MRPNDAFGLVDGPIALDALEARGPEVSTLPVSVVGLVAPRTTETDHTRPELMLGGIKGLTTLRTVAGGEVPEWIIAFQTTHSRLHT